MHEPRWAICKPATTPGCLCWEQVQGMKQRVDKQVRALGVARVTLLYLGSCHSQDLRVTSWVTFVRLYGCGSVWVYMDLVARALRTSGVR